VLSVFVSLSAVGDDMGALGLWLGTHTHFSAHANEAAAAWADATPAARIARVPPGSVVVMDSRTQHRGSANTPDRERPVFYCTWMSEHGMPPTGSTCSMRRKVRRHDRPAGRPGPIVPRHRRGARPRERRSC